MFSKSCQYAIKAVIYIHKQSLDGKKVGAKEIGQEIDTPDAFTAKILQVLVKQHVVGSFKGPTGGFFVDKSHESKTLKDVVMAIDGDNLFQGCSLGLNQCSEKNPCPLHFEIVKVRSNIHYMLTSKSLKQLAEEVGDGSTVLARLV
ncbi:Rrf2 family transcriptional regulator [Aquiflexum sp. TKW24L]|uniref:RrF2 family transcriptional regulator n=1 Tax=Aquiflexum sp. TKW24L TaxID=2942212 RepID=UPI0020BEE319|nr:Rrf2 family transcriptional regulator [Aquiflexum sp. TKW24L]MCL6260235.1 Rrf2 family transcriptional regulator [Aquiflexum sp. TKW24L]